MSNNRVDRFHGNVAAWKSIAEIQIDYFSQFVKAWIPFNAWFSTNYQSENNDRDILNRLKRENNPFKEKIILLLSRDDSESLEFQNQLGRLHTELERSPIPSLDRVISFKRVIVEKNTLPSSDNFVTGRNYKFKVITTYNHNAQAGVQRINVQVIDVLTNQGKMNWNQNDWDIEELKSQQQFKLKNVSKVKVRSEIQKELITCYEKINPLKPTNLVLEPVKKNKSSTILVSPPNSLTIDLNKKLFFVEDVELITKGLIEILYNIRNVLFHGEINPSEDVQRIYKEAYFVLYPLIKTLS